jgi:hypothetical protein
MEVIGGNIIIAEKRKVAKFRLKKKCACPVN